MKAAPRGDGRGRRWTHHRLRVVLGVAFGVNARGRPDTAAAAVALGVSRRTVQRWLHGADRTLPDLRKRGRIRTHTTVATRFHATALAYALLQQVDPWRVQSPAGVVKQGRTQAWLAAAPARKLPERAAAEGLA